MSQSVPPSPPSIMAPARPKKVCSSSPPTSAPEPRSVSAGNGPAYASQTAKGSAGGGGLTVPPPGVPDPPPGAGAGPWACSGVAMDASAAVAASGARVVSAPNARTAPMATTPSKPVKATYSVSDAARVEVRRVESVSMVGLPCLVVVFAPTERSRENRGAIPNRQAHKSDRAEEAAASVGWPLPLARLLAVAAGKGPSARRTCCATKRAARRVQGLSVRKVLRWRGLSGLGSGCFCWWRSQSRWGP